MKPELPAPTYLPLLSPEIDPRLTLGVSCFTFLPLEQFSDKAAHIAEKHIAKVTQALSSYPPGLRAQYEVQLEHLKNKKVPDGEILTTPLSPTMPGKQQSAGPYMRIGILRLWVDHTKLYAHFVSVNCHPWSRGSIV